MAQTMTHDHDHYTSNGQHMVTHEVGLKNIGQWLKKGWVDIAAAPLESLFYGGMMTLFVLLVYSSFQHSPFMVFVLSTMFVLIAPFMATGLYYIARQVDRGHNPDLLQSMVVWRKNLTGFASFALVLGVIVSIWSRIVPMIIAVVESNSLLIVDPDAGLMGFLQSQAGIEFMIAYAVIGSLVAAFVFAISVVSIPLMLQEKRMGAISAAILSYEVVMENKMVMLAWALVVGALVALSIVTLGIGMLIVMPLLGFASWHAFKDLVDVDHQS